MMEELLSIGVVSVSIVGDISLGGSIKSLGDGVKSRAGSERNIGMGVGVSIGSIEDSSVSISGPLGDESLGDGVLTRGVSEGDTVGSISIGVSSIEEGGVSLSISRPLAVVTMVSVSVVGDISLGHWVEALGDGVKSRAGTKWNISIGVGVTEASIVSIGISLSS